MKIETIETKLAVRPERRVKAVAALLEGRDVATIFALVAREKEITIFVVAADIGEVGICVSYGDEIPARNGAQELAELFEKRPPRIVASSGAACIPSIAPPRRLLVDRKARAGWIDRDELLPGRVADSLIQRSFVSKSEPGLHPAARTG